MPGWLKKPKKISGYERKKIRSYMEIRVAKNAGFCFGVKRAVEFVYKELESGDMIYTFGPIIHNEEVIREFEERGVRIINSEEELRELASLYKKEGNIEGKKAAVIIRSHGVKKEIYDIINEGGLRLCDATCPFVKKIHDIVRNESLNGKKILILGNENHPEVEGIKGWCLSEPTIIETKEEAARFREIPKKEVCLVAQTTFNSQKFQYLVEILKNSCYTINTVNTICNATESRQAEASEIAKEVDAMLVVGGAKSSNTQKLFEICGKECKNTYFVQTARDLKAIDLSLIKRLGVTAGASTPNNIIEEICNYVRFNF